jgi:hypothetical protein
MSPEIYYFDKTNGLYTSLKNELFPSTLSGERETCVDKPMQKVLTFYELGKTTPHHMNVLNPEEMELDIFVKVFILVSLACRSVSHCVYLETNKRRDILHEILSTRGLIEETVTMEVYIVP